MELDERDRKLIALLKNDSRESVVSLGRKLGVSRTTVKNRIDVLKRRGIIKAFTVIFDEEYNRQFLKAQILINLRTGLSRRVVNELLKCPQVTKVSSVSGIYDLIVELTVENSSELDQLINEIQEIEGVEQTLSCIVLAQHSYKD